MQDTVVVRYGELFLKSDYVRRKFEEKLLENISATLKDKKFNFKIIKKRLRCVIKTDKPHEVAEAVAKVFGVVSTSPAVFVSSNLDEISEVSVKIAERTIKKNNTFAVQAKRTGKHEFSSKDVEVLVGKKIQEKTGAKVNLDNPEKIIFIEIHDEETFIFTEKIRGVGGLPYGTQGKLVALVSDLNSGVAAFMLMRRGCEIVGLHFGEESEVRDILKKLEEYSPKKLKLIINNKKIPKEKMYQIAEEIAKRENAFGVVSGELLDDLSPVNLKIPIYRPLVGLNGDKISKTAKEIRLIAKHINL